MAKFNVVQKKRRECVRQRKRAIHGDPVSGKLKSRTQPLSVSGKRQRKLLKKWRREQKEAIEKGLVSMEDVEMAAAQGEGSSKNGKKTPTKFNMKKGLKLKHMKRNGKQKGKKSKAATEAPEDAMVE
ncbi:uncharacterized protein [Euphorbia lathyris]|uniref:uncharacterized protein n=1 Tax=Euphorbia lathyris TaxID=212925 RepID=UPI003313CC81